MPVATSGVMLVLKRVRHSVSKASPPALAALPRVVWQTAQLPSAASSAPRAMAAAKYIAGSGRAIGAMARPGSSAVPIPATAVHSAAIVATKPRDLANVFFHVRDGAAVAGAGNALADAGRSPRNPLRMRSGVNGGSRKWTPVA